jgi:hypothetical protein
VTPNLPDHLVSGTQTVDDTTHNGTGSDAFGVDDETDDGKKVLVGFDDSGQALMYDSSDAKDWYEAQFVQGTKYADQLRGQLSKLGYEDDRDMLYALSRGVDFASSKFSTENGYGAGNAFEWILSQPVDNGGGSGGPFSSTQTIRDISSADEAMSDADVAYQSQMGRRATMDEGKAYQQVVNMMERQNPTISTTSGNSSGRSTVSSTTTKGGFDSKRFAEDWVRSQEGYGETYAATTFMQLLDEAISQPDVIRQRMEEIA